MKGLGRHLTVKGDGGAGVVDLHQQPIIDDHFVFGVHRVGDGMHHVFFALVILVLAVGDRARRRGNRQETLLDIDFGERGLEIVDVALQLHLTGIGDSADADRVAAARAAVMRVQFLVEFLELRAIGAIGVRIAPRGAGPRFEAREPLQYILRPTDRLAEFAVTDHIEADPGLLVHDLGDAVGEAALIGVVVIGGVVALGAQEGDQLGRPDQAADMGRQDSFLATLQRSSP